MRMRVTRQASSLRNINTNSSSQRISSRFAININKAALNLMDIKSIATVVTLQTGKGRLGREGEEDEFRFQEHIELIEFNAQNQ